MKFAHDIPDIHDAEEVFKLGWRGLQIELLRIFISVHFVKSVIEVLAGARDVCSSAN